MQRIEAYGRHRRRKRMAVILLAGLGLIAAENTLVHRHSDDAGRLDVPRAALATPRTTTPVKALAASQALPTPMNAVATSQAAKRALARSGVLPGDIVLAVDRKPIRDALQLQQMLNDAANCGPVPVEVVRDGKTLTYTTAPANKGPCNTAPVPLHRR
jgi:S1-C subfamily serine protease